MAIMRTPVRRAPMRRPVMQRPAPSGLMRGLGQARQVAGLGSMGAKLAGIKGVGGLGAVGGALGTAGALSNIASGRGGVGDYLSLGKTGYQMYSGLGGGAGTAGTGATSAAGGTAAGGGAGASGALTGASGAALAFALPVAAMMYMESDNAKQEAMAQRRGMEAYGALAKAGVDPTKLLQYSLTPGDQSVGALQNAYREQLRREYINPMSQGLSAEQFIGQHTPTTRVDPARFREYMTKSGAGNLLAPEHNMEKQFSDLMLVGDKLGLGWNDIVKAKNLEQQQQLLGNPGLMGGLRQMQAGGLGAVGLSPAQIAAERLAASQGMTADEYLRNTGMTPEQILYSQTAGGG